MCPGCQINPETGRCQYGGPYRTAPAEPIDEAEYMGRVYGKALPPIFANGKWHPQYEPFGILERAQR